MAKVTKQGLDYFPVDCFDDNNLRLVQAKFGIEGFGIVLKLMQRIYGIHGYYTGWDEDIAELFAYENRLEIQTLEAVLNFALTKGIFDKEKYDEYGILTSKEIQQSYTEATQRRKNVTLDSRYVLIMYTSCQHNDNKSEQSKVKESKVKESISKESRVEESESVQHDANTYAVLQDEAYASPPPSAEKGENCGIFREDAPQSTVYGDIVPPDPTYGDIIPPEPIYGDIIPPEPIYGENSPPPPTNEEKKRYGEYNNVLLTEKEHKRFLGEFPAYGNMVIERLSEYIACRGKSYPAHYPVLRKWAREDKEKFTRKKEKEPSFDVDEFFDLALKRSSERLGKGG